MNEKTNKGLPEIRKSVIIDAPIEKVWQAVSTSDGIASWWMPNTFQAFVGHEFVLRTGQLGDSPCRVTQVSPPNSIEFDWDEDWHLAFELKALSDKRTEFSIIHSGWNVKEKNRFGQQYSKIWPVMDEGWEKIVKIRFVGYVEKY